MTYCSRVNSKGPKQKAQKVFIVIEDIDQSGDAGTFFLETMKQFLRELETKKQVIVIVPMSEDTLGHSQIMWLKMSGPL